MEQIDFLNETMLLGKTYDIHLKQRNKNNSESLIPYL